MRIGPKLAAIGATLAIASGALAACGGEDEASASEYVSAVCGAFSDFQATMAEGQTEIQQTSPNADPESSKELLTGFFTDASAAADDAKSQIEDAGTPDVENGEEVADAVNSTVDGLASGLDQAASDAEALPTDSEAEFASSAQQLATSLQETVANGAQAAEQVQNNSELQAAADENADCQALEGGAPGATGAPGDEGA